MQASSKKRPRWRRALVIGVQVFVGLGIGAGVAEYAFDRRDDGAFPHVNFYVADPELGVRLEPGASMRFRLRQNPLSTIHVNSRGYRGGEWPAPAATDVLVVGDSQVFGLGVEDDATFSSRLAAASGRNVVNAGVPTYGPGEYLAVARELLAERKLATVVVVLNFVNDPFELGRPNHTRHTVWDGWAVRSETAPGSVLEFPGRRRLFSQSHAVYALRRWLHDRGAAAAPESADLDSGLDLGTPSEGGLHDLVVASNSAHQEAARSEVEAGQMLAQTRQRAEVVTRELDDKLGDLDSLVNQASNFRFDYYNSQVARSSPGDIVNDNSSEEGRAVVVTAAMIREAARTREALLAKVLKGEAKQAQVANTLLADQKTLAAERDVLRAQIASGVPPIPRPASQFRGYLEEFKKLCDEHGAELVVVALPIDVQVDRREWAKYGVTEAPDMTASLVLLDDLVADARELGVRALDATAALRAAEPDAFLDHDIHMTAKGHAALAGALAETLVAPVSPPPQGPRPGLPRGRSFVPTTAEWSAAPELAIPGASEAGCKVQARREWVRVLCSNRNRFDRYRRLLLGAGATPATMLVASDDAISIVTPMTVGQPFTARLMSKGSKSKGGPGTGGGSHEIQLTATAGPKGDPVHQGSFVAADFRDMGGFAFPDFKLAQPTRELCECHREVFKERLCDPERPSEGECPLVCGSLWGDPRLAAACTGAHGKCEERLACAQNDPLFAPACPEGQIHAFASNACFAVCDPQRPCATGTCTPWHGGAVCVPD